MKNRPTDDRTIDDEKPRAPVKVLSADDIFAVEDLNILPVEVPEWGGMVYVKAMSAIQREKYIESMRRTVSDGKVVSTQMILRHGSAKLAALTICDAQGNLLFDRSPETIEKLGQKSAKAMERVIDASAKLNGLDDDKKDKKVKELGKNDSAGQPDDDAGLNID